MLQRGGTQSDPASRAVESDPADPRPEEAPARRDGGQLADGAAPYQEHPGEDATLPPRWEGNKNEGKFVTVARTPRMQRTPDEEIPGKGETPQKSTRPAGRTRRQDPLLVHGARTCPRCLVGPGQTLRPRPRGGQLRVEGDQPSRGSSKKTAATSCREI